MKILQEIAFDYALCQKQVEAFREFLASNEELSERKDILPFFRERQQMALLFDMFNTQIGEADRIGWEFDIYGDFAADLVVGSWSRGAYCLVEFEDAFNNSIFEKQGKKATREWGRKFDHGISQIIDWIHKLDGRTPSNDLLSRFGRYEINYEAVLVIGRDKHLDEGEKQRFNWRTDKVAVNTKKIKCMTFDELLSQFTRRISAFSAAIAAAKTRPNDPNDASDSTRNDKSRPG